MDQTRKAQGCKEQESRREMITSGELSAVHASGTYSGLVRQDRGMCGPRASRRIAMLLKVIVHRS